MIKSFRCPETARLARDESSRKFRTIERIARRKLTMLAAAKRLDEMRSPPGNRLEPLKGNRLGQHSIRINDQWRQCFRWDGEGAVDVEIVDYH
jgi:proteic killer suppression protein